MCKGEIGLNGFPGNVCIKFSGMSSGRREHENVCIDSAGTETFMCVAPAELKNRVLTYELLWLLRKRT